VATLQAPEPLRPGDAPDLPGFRLLGILGRGGMGVVYRAEQASPRRPVAVKLLNAATTPERLAAFRREAALIAALEHPHIVPLYAFGEHGGQPYLALRWLRGGSAADRVGQGALPPESVATWIAETAAALDFAHQRGLVHRDVKPSNILLDEAGHAYLTDFGIAGTLTDPASGQALGSAAYMAPEQGRGEATDHRADIYALAVTAFELLTGHKPYIAETPLGVIVRAIHDPIPSACAFNPALPEAVDAAIAHGMAKAALDRPASARAFARDLAAALGHAAPAGRTAAASFPTVVEASPAQAPTPTLLAPTAAVPPAQPAPAARPATRLGLGLGALALVVCLLISALLAGGLGLAALFGGEADTPSPATPNRSAGPTITAPPVALLLADDFSDPNSGFATLADEEGSVAYSDGVLLFTVLVEEVEWRPPSRRVVAQDVSITVSTTRRSGPPRSEWGVLCRWQGAENYVALAVSAAGQAGIWRRIDGENEWLAPWAEVEGALLGRGGQLTLTATCAGESLRLEAGGQLLAEAADPAPAPGDVALLARLLEPGEMVVAFDDLLVTKPR